MAPLWEQRRNLIDANAKLMREWLRQLPPEQQLNLFESMLRKYSVTELRAMNTHLKAQVRQPAQVVWDVPLYTPGYEEETS